MILVAEIVDFQRFRHPRELMAYLGLVPSEYSSADTQRRGSITKAGNTHARRALVEAAWHYRHLVGHGKRPPIAVVAIARELAGFIWAAMTQRVAA